MVYTNWYPGAPSMTASKYLKYSVAYTKPFEPGQRYRNRRDMELTVSIAYFVVLIRSCHWSEVPKNVNLIFVRYPDTATFTETCGPPPRKSSTREVKSYLT